MGAPKAVPTIDVLREARELIADPKRWARGSRCLRDDSTGLDRHCVIGAVERVSQIKLGLSVAPFDLMPLWNTRGYRELRNALSRLAARRGYPGGAMSANDDGGHTAALAILDDAIAELEAAP